MTVYRQACGSGGIIWSEHERPNASKPGTDTDIPIMLVKGGCQFRLVVNLSLGVLDRMTYLSQVRRYHLGSDFFSFFSMVYKFWKNGILPIMIMRSCSILSGCNRIFGFSGYFNWNLASLDSFTRWRILGTHNPTLYKGQIVFLWKMFFATLFY